MMSSGPAFKTKVFGSSLCSLTKAVDSRLKVNDGVKDAVLQPANALKFTICAQNRSVSINVNSKLDLLLNFNIQLRLKHENGAIPLQSSNERNVARFECPQQNDFAFIQFFA